METEQRMAEAMRLHVQALLEDRLPIPESRSSAEFVTVGDGRARSEHLSRSGLIREALKAFMRESELATGGSSTAAHIPADRLRAFCSRRTGLPRC